MTPTDTLREAVARAIKPLRWLGDTAVSSVGFYRIETFKSGFVWSVDGIRGNHLRPSKSSDDARLLAQADFAAKMLAAFDLDAAITAIEAAGWRIVPAEPTQEMVRASLRLDLSYMPDHQGADRSAVYAAMLSAAPRLDATVRSGEEG